MSVWQTIVGIASPLIVAGGATVGVVASRRTGAEANRTADWEKFTTRIESWTARELGAQTERIAALEVDVDELRDERNQFRDERDEFRRKYDSAIAYLRWITRELSRVLPDVDFKPPPNIADDL